MAYVLTKTVDACEKLRDYQRAVDLLRLLLKQSIYLIDYRGSPFQVREELDIFYQLSLDFTGLWYERLTLDLDQHLKQPLEALRAVEDGLKDPNVRVARKLALCQRVTKILGMKKNAKVQQQVLTILFLK